jgi:hypothetical protein
MRFGIYMFESINLEIRVSNEVLDQLVGNIDSNSHG